LPAFGYLCPEKNAPRSPPPISIYARPPQHLTEIESNSIAA
jgi:hypothetical protein